MPSDDSSNFLKNLADPKSWSDGMGFNYTPPQEKANRKEAVSVSSGLPAIMSGDQFPQQYELTKRPPLIDNFVRRGEVVLLTAASKMGKSWTLQTAATCLAEGVPFLGLETAKSNVLMLDLELHQADAQDRLWSIALAMGLKHPPKNLYLWNLRKHTYDLPVIIETLHSRLDELPEIDAIFLDPVYMLGQTEGFDENSSSSITSLFTELEKITLKSDAALFVSHHTRKGTMGRESHIDRGSGSGVFARFPDCLVSLSPHQLPEHAIVEMTSRSQKSPRPFVIKMSPPVIELAENADPYAHRRYGDAPQVENTDETILELIPPGQSLTRNEWAGKARMQGASEANFETHFNSLNGSGRIKQVDRDGVVAYVRTIQ